MLTSLHSSYAITLIAVDKPLTLSSSHSAMLGTKLSSLTDHLAESAASSICAPDNDRGCSFKACLLCYLPPNDYV